MKIRLKQEMSGMRHASPWPAVNEVFEVDDDEGAQLCRLGIAEPVVDDKTEKAVPPKAEIRGEAGPELAVGEATAVKRGPGRPRKNP